jgi:NADH dehydrogenase
VERKPEITSVFVTGGTGFVGRAVVRELLSRGMTPVCLVRSLGKLHSQHPEVNPERLVEIVGDLFDAKDLHAALDRSQAVIHLVGIIIARPLRGQTFHRIHVKGTQNVVHAIRGHDIRRYLHMSALGTRPDAVSKYHQTKWAAEEIVRNTGLEWTIFRPSIIHGPDGDFMRLMKSFMCGLLPPVIPYFGSGTARLQPVSAKDVAYCFVESLVRPETIGQVIPLGGPRPYSWIELYETCRALIPGARNWKPLVSQPVALAKVVAVASTPVMALAEKIVKSAGLFRFNVGQVQMSQEDSICDPTIAERVFGIRMRSFEEELAVYADQIK